MTKPEIGQGATKYGFTDRYPFTVISVSPSGRRCVVQEDKATRTDTNGMSESQTYAFSPDPEGTKFEISYRSDGRWREVNGTTVFMVGVRRKYHDYSF